jgi:hypothetical protein
LRFEADLRDADEMPAMLKKAALAGGYAFVKAMWPSGAAGDVQPAANLARRHPHAGPRCPRNGQPSTALDFTLFPAPECAIL